MKRWRQNNPDRVKSYSIEQVYHYHIRSRYKINGADYKALLKKQNHLCAICKKPEMQGRSLQIDHNHTSGAIRALLCGRCNRGLGHFQDSPEILLAACQYLKEHQKNA